MGLDQYLYKVEKKCETNEELEHILDIGRMLEDTDELKYYDDVKAGKYEQYLKDNFTSDFVKKVMLSFKIKENADVADGLDSEYLEEVNKSKEKFLNIYVPRYIKGVEGYKKVIAAKEDISNYIEEEIE